MEEIFNIEQMTVYSCVERKEILFFPKEFYLY